MLNSNTAAEDPQVAARGRAASTTRSSPTSTRVDRHVDPGDVGRARARYEDVADHRLHQLRPGRRGQAGAGRRRRVACRCCRSPRRSTGTRAFPAGDVTVRDVAGLYIYDNTLLGVKVTGARVKDYLEYSARVLQAGQPAPGPFADGPTSPTRSRRRRRTAPRTTTTTSSAGLDAPPDLRHRHRPAGRLADREPRVRRRAGRPARSSSSMAINNYRQSGGGGFPRGRAPRRSSTTAQVEIRQLLIDWVTRQPHHRPGAVRLASTGGWSRTGSRSRSPERRGQSSSAITSRSRATAAATSSAVWPVRSRRSATAWPFFAACVDQARSGPRR